MQTFSFVCIFFIFLAGEVASLLFIYRACRHIVLLGSSACGCSPFSFHRFWHSGADDPRSPPQRPTLGKKASYSLYRLVGYSLTASFILHHSGARRRANGCSDLVVRKYILNNHCGIRACIRCGPYVFEVFYYELPMFFCLIFLPCPARSCPVCDVCFVLSLGTCAYVDR